MYENKMRKRLRLGLKEEHPFPLRRWMFCGLKCMRLQLLLRECVFRYEIILLHLLFF